MKANNEVDAPNSKNLSESNLSNKITKCVGIDGVLFLDVEDVKEFIKRDWKLTLNFVAGKINSTEFLNKKRRLAGEKLK